MQQKGTRFIAELTKGKNLIFIFKNKGNPLFKMAMKLFGATSFDHAVVICLGNKTLFSGGLFGFVYGKFALKREMIYRSILISFCLFIYLNINLIIKGNCKFE